MNASVAHTALPSGLSDLWSLAAQQPVARNGRSLVIAVATTVGAHIDRDFEEAEAFLLYEKSAGGTCFIGCQPCPLAGEGSDMTTRTRLLADCDLVLCASISERCRQTLSTLRIECNLTYAGAAVGDALLAVQPAVVN